MTQEDVLKLADFKNKKIIELSNKIKEDVIHLPDINAIGRISNHISFIRELQIELEILKRVLI